MKKLEAIVQPSKVEDVKKALVEIGLKGLNVGKIEGFAQDSKRKRAVRSVEYQVDVVPMATISTVVDDAVVDSAIAAIKKAASTGRSGDGRIFVSDIGQAINIRNGKSGNLAISRPSETEQRGAA